MQVGILGTGMYLPSRIVSNHELSTTLETTNEWIVEKLGIRQRHIAAPEQATSDLAVEAARRALDDANTRASELDLIIVATSTPDMLQPPTAAFVQARLESPGAAAFDVAAVCAGFVYAISVAASMLAFNSRWKRALVIGADTYSRILDWKDRKTCVIFGDGAGAVVLGQVEPELGIVATTLGSDGTKAALVRYPGGGSRFPASQATITKNLHRFEMDGRAVFDFAVDAIPRMTKQVVREAGSTLADVDLIVPHQANANVLRVCAKSMGVAVERMAIDLEDIGNTASASIPIALHRARRAGRLKRGNGVVLVGIGGGLSYGAVYARWALD